jgi:hypothetical protein
MKRRELLSDSSLDCRVKPGNDEERRRRVASGYWMPTLTGMTKKEGRGEKGRREKGDEISFALKQREAR